jgi:hypothetical protein
MNHTYWVEFRKQHTENPKYQKSKVPNTIVRPYIFIIGSSRAKIGGISLGYTSGYTVEIIIEVRKPNGHV